MLIQWIFLYYRENCHRQCKGAAGTAATRGKTGSTTSGLKSNETGIILHRGMRFPRILGVPELDRSPSIVRHVEQCRRVVGGCRRVSKNVGGVEGYRRGTWGRCGGLRSGS